MQWSDSHFRFRAPSFPELSVLLHVRWKGCVRASQQRILLWAQPCRVGDGRGRRAEPRHKARKGQSEHWRLGMGVGGVHARSVTQSCPTLCDPMGCSPPGSSVHGILQARILDWAAVLSSRGSS